MAESAAIELTAAWVASAIGGTIRSGSPTQMFEGVSIDSRTIAAGELFVAIRGERFDGAAYANAAVERGAAGIVVPPAFDGGRSTAGTPTAPVVIVVEDTTAALQSLGRAVRRASGAKVVAITGSAGKTTTKEVTSEFLETRYTVVRNRGNLNNHIGLPLSLIALRSRPDAAVMELGMNHAGEIRTLVGIAEPDVRVWTNVGEAHLGYFASVDAIADAKAEIFEGSSASTVLVANADDERIVARLPRFAGRTRTFGIEHEADVRAHDVVDGGIDGMSAHVTTPSGSIDLSTPLIGRGSLANVLAATAVACEFDVPLEAIADRAKRLAPAPHRGVVIRLANGATIVDDSYNANPSATVGALDVLARTSGVARRIAVLGEMLELGAQANPLHEMVGRRAARVGIDQLLTVGGEPAAAMAAAAIGAGLPASAVHHYGASNEAADATVRLIRPGDVVLVKGSRGIRTDAVVDRLISIAAERS